jgi:hypothetical protein
MRGYPLCLSRGFCILLLYYLIFCLLVVGAYQAFLSNYGSHFVLNYTKIYIHMSSLVHAR